MTQDNKNIAEQTTESGSLGSTDQASGKLRGALTPTNLLLFNTSMIRLSKKPAFVF